MKPEGVKYICTLSLQLQLSCRGSEKLWEKDKTISSYVFFTNELSIQNLIEIYEKRKEKRNTHNKKNN